MAEAHHASCYECLPIHLLYLLPLPGTFSPFSPLITYLIVSSEQLKVQGVTAAFSSHDLPWCGHASSCSNIIKLLTSSVFLWVLSLTPDWHRG